VIDEYTQLHTVFEYFGSNKSQNPLQKDVTISVADLMNIMKKAKILDTDRLNIVELIEVIEKYHANDGG
jgi:hypothetical protein